MHLIQGVVRDYDWGDRAAIAEILGHEPPGHPEAEYWLGAHPSAPSLLLDLGLTLDEFATLPFLLKILAADKPLSIQAHPSLAQAVAGFERENAAGIEVDAPNRSYRDENHKPELICALTPFEAKCGFRPVAEARRLVAAMEDDRLEPLSQRLAASGPVEEVLADTVAWLLRLPAGDAAELALAAKEAAAAYRDRGEASEADEFAVAMRWTVSIYEDFPGDIGVVVALLLNHVSLEPGQAIFLQAGNLHSYLTGVGIELMANSDNVLRGGLTPKHIDVDELLEVVDYEPSDAPVQGPEGPVHRFESPVPEFCLTRLDSTDGEVIDSSFDPAGPEIVLVTSGGVRLERADSAKPGSSELELPCGSTAFVPHDDGTYRLVDTEPGRTIAWRAAVGSAVY